MCTAISFISKDHYFGRNLDLYYHYNEEVVITPRNYPFTFRCKEEFKTHYAMIGMATVAENYPLYYEATNEKGLSIAGLNFPDNAVYREPAENKDNITPFELIPWLLGSSADIFEAEEKLKNINITNINFNGKLPLSPLHWLISDKNGSLTLESRADGLKIFKNPIGVLTNNPPFETQMLLLQNYIQLSPEMPINRFSNTLALEPYSLGMGAMGLPGDLSSPSRFVRGAFAKLNSVCDENENSSVSQFFHILGAVAQQRGLVKTQKGEYEYTLYSSCCNTDKGIYYYTTYENSAITAIDMKNRDLNSDKLMIFPLVKNQQIKFL